MNLLITGAWEQASQFIPQIRSMGNEVCFLQKESDTLPCPPEWVDGIICNSIFRFHPIEEFKNLRWIQLNSAGYDRIPMEYIREHNIQFYTAKDVYSIPMAEHAVLGVLYLLRKMDFFRENQKIKQWEKNRSLRELFGKTVMIIGCGSVGSACAERFHAFGCEVHGIVHQHPAAEHFDMVHPVSELDQWLPKTDVLIIAAALNEETRGLINSQRLSLLKDDAILVNISRGSIIDEKALCSRIKALGGAVLDVFEEEPLSPESPLWSEPNVLITPHNSFVSENIGTRLSEVIMRNLQEGG